MIVCTEGESIMKKLYYLAIVGLLTTCLAGCNRGWPNCFSRGMSYAPQTCEPCESCCEGEAYEGYENYYVEPGAEWVPATTPTPVESLPTPGPAAEDVGS